MAKYDIVYKNPSKDNHTFQFDFDFKIPNFLGECYDYGQFAGGNEFEGLTPYEGVKWRVIPVVFPRGRVRDYHAYAAMSLYLRILTVPSNASLAISANVTVGIKGACEAPQLSIDEREDTKNQWASTNGNGKQNYLPIGYFKEHCEKVLPDGDLTLQFKGKADIQFDSTICKDSSKTLSVPTTIPDPNVTNNIVERLFTEGIGSDVTLTAKGREFKCHKWVLSLRCDYFRAMFASGLKESQDGVVDFSQDMDGEQLKDLLHYLYLGMASNLDKTCGVMLKMAEMLDLQDLKSQSEQLLIQQLKTDNAWDLLDLARKQGAKSLQKEALLLLAKIDVFAC